MTTTAAASISSASRKCVITSSGFSFKITVSAAQRDLRQGADEDTSARRSTHRDRPRVRRAAEPGEEREADRDRADHAVAELDERVPPFSGNGVQPQRGQWSQPRPEPVSRTTAPVVTTRKIQISAAREILRKWAGPISDEAADRRAAGPREAGRCAAEPVDIT